MRKPRRLERLAAPTGGHDPRHALPLWVPLQGRGMAASLVGGKAAALDRLIAQGAPVPRAAVLTTEAYVRFVDAGDLRAIVAAPSGKPDDLEAAFLDAPLPEVVRHAIACAFSYASPGGAVAVRSSAVAEDMPSASFAGQYQSFLGVGPDDLDHAVRRCWASLWSPQARAYRRARSLTGTGVAMAVVIQTMVEAEHSGVLFTVDPTVPDADVMRVEVVAGLGERLVSGALTPNVYRIRRGDLTAIEPGAPSFLPELGRLALEIEQEQGAPQDIEWSLTDTGLHLLQARPITAGPTPAADPFDTPTVPGATFTPIGVAEMLPGVLPPLLWTSNAPMLEDAFVSVFRQLGIRFPGAPQPMVGRFRGRAALNLSLLKAAARQMPRGSAAEIERQYLGRVVSGETEEPRPTLHQRVRRVLSATKALGLQKRLPAEAEVFLAATDMVLDLQPDLSRAAADALVIYRHRLRDLARRGVRVEVAVSASAAANYRALEVVLGRWLGADEAPLATQRLTSGSTRRQVGGCGAVLALWDVHCEHCQDPDVARAVYEGPVEGIEQRLMALGDAGAAFLGLVDEGLRRAGCAAVYAGPAWEEEDRAAFWTLLRRCRGSADTPTAATSRSAGGAEAYLGELERRLTRNRRWRTTRILTGQIVDVRRRLLRRMIADTGTFLSLREAVKSSVLQLGGVERRVLRELTQRLAADGLIERDGDEWLLSDDELDTLALGGPGPAPDVLARRRHALTRARSAPPLPEVFVEAPPAAAEPRQDTGENVLRGWATSPGRVTGRALVVTDVAEARGVTSADILVGHSTDPSWTPLFLTVAGIVMERGGPLSHAAIVAREFGVPAVLNVDGATRRIRTGATITVDGTQGTVEIVADGVGEAA